MRKFSTGLILLLATLSLSGQSFKSLDDYVKERYTDKSGLEVEVIIVPGTPPGDHREPVAVPDRASVTIANVPAYDWCFGCSATAASMMAGYYDRTSLPNCYTGPTNGGIAPLDNSVWGTVFIGGETRSQCPFSATRQGLDGRATRGHVDDYWIQTDNPGPDPFIINGWTEHISGDCTGDFMRTSQSVYGNVDGGTIFTNYVNGSPYSDPGSDNDGMFGLKLFYESRGYYVASHFNQYIYGYNGNTLGFTFNQYKAEINAGRPVMIQVAGHTMLGIGYNDTGQLVYLHDTWDYSLHSMTWGGTYSGMQHYGVGVMRVYPGPVGPCANVLPINGTGAGNSKTYPGGGTGEWFTSSGNPCGYNTPGLEQVYSFVAPFTGTFNIQVTAANGWVDYLWRASSCNTYGWTCISDIISPGSYGNMSWTGGVTYYILLDDEDNSAGAHTFYINGIQTVPDNLLLQNIIITNSQDECYGAAQTITVAGSGTTFTVHNGGIANIIAGQNILFLPGTLIQSGGYLKGRITTDNTYCIP